MDKNDNIVEGINAILEFNSQQVCGLQFTNFSPENFGWWSCEMNNEDTKSVFHRGTFEINKPNEWPTDIRLPTDIQVFFPLYVWYGSNGLKIV